MIKTLGECDISAQETVHLLLSLKLYSSTFNAVPVNIEGSRRIKLGSQGGDSPCTEDSLHDHYANRAKYERKLLDGHIMTLDFVDFTRMYKIVSGEITKPPENVVLRVFPTYSSNPKQTLSHFIASINS